MNNPKPVIQVKANSLENAPAFIEHQFPVGRLSAESYLSRENNILTALGSFWKGRKPLILVRATILGCLLPKTDRPIEDLRLFLALLNMDDTAFDRRLRSIPPTKVNPDWPTYPELIDFDDDDEPKWRDDLTKEQRQTLILQSVLSLPYNDRLNYCSRPEELPDDSQPEELWHQVNNHFGTHANSLHELVQQLGIMRFGHRPIVGDTFCGGGSIPFEAARIGCEAVASDLNPVATMLTWGAFNVIGNGDQKEFEIKSEQHKLKHDLETEISRLKIESDAHGNRAKAFLYCVETKCPRTGWLVPMATTWIISKKHRVVAKLTPDPIACRYVTVHTPLYFRRSRDVGLVLA